MDNQAYLDKISASTKSDLTPSSGKFSLSNIIASPFFKIGVGVFLLIILIIILGSVISNASNKTVVLSEQLSIRLSNLTETINEYGDNLKDSSLRAFNAQFISTVKDTKNQLDTNFLSTDGKGFDIKEAPAKIVSEEQDLIDNLNQEFEEARMNGILDRVYINKIKAQISLILSLESSIASRTKNDEFKNFINASFSNFESLLENLEDNFSSSD